MERRRVAVTGIGTVNPTGNDVAESWANIRAGRSGIGPVTRFDTENYTFRVAGEVKNFDPQKRIDRREIRKMSLYSQYAMYAAAEAMEMSGLDVSSDHPDPRAGVIISSGIGGLIAIEENHDRGREKGFDRVNPYFIPMAISNMAAAGIAIRYGLQGMCTCPVTACAGGSNAIGDAFHRIREGYEDVMVCGGTEADVKSPDVIGAHRAHAVLASRLPLLRLLVPDASLGREGECAEAVKSHGVTVEHEVLHCLAEGSEASLHLSLSHVDEAAGPAQDELLVQLAVGNQIAVRLLSAGILIRLAAHLVSKATAMLLNRKNLCHSNSDFEINNFS